MGHVLVMQSQLGLGGIISRLLAGRHTVTEQTIPPDVVDPPALGMHFDAVVCALSDARAAYEALSRAGHPDLHKVIFVVSAASARSIEDLPNPRLVKPFSLGDLSTAIEAMVARSAGKPPER